MLEPCVHEGLDMVVVCDTGLSVYDGARGTFALRGGVPIHRAASWPFERTAGVLLEGAAATSKSLDVGRQLARGRTLSPNTQQLIASRLDRLDVELTPSTAMDLARLGTELECVQTGAAEGIDVLSATLIIGKVSAVLAFMGRHVLSHGGEIERSCPDSTHVHDILRTMHGRDPSPPEIECLNTYMTVMADHGMNPSTFAACVAISAGSDLVSAVVAGFSTLKGGSHGGAVSRACALVGRISDGEVTATEALSQTLDGDGRLPGFGHREYKTYDPRAKVFRELCAEHNPRYYEAAKTLEDVALEYFGSRIETRGISVNVDYYAGGVLQAAGIPDVLHPVCFASARVVGWCAHAIEYATRTGRLISPTSQWSPQ